MEETLAGNISANIAHQSIKGRGKVKKMHPALGCRSCCFSPKAFQRSGTCPPDCGLRSDRFSGVPGGRGNADGAWTQSGNFPTEARGCHATPGARVVYFHCRPDLCELAQKDVLKNPTDPAGRAFLWCFSWRAQSARNMRVHRVTNITG